MFKCRECGKEYDFNPDYCECGNDTFDEFINEIEEIGEFDVVSNPQPKKLAINPGIIVFVLCIILSLLILILGSKPKSSAPAKKEPVKTQQSAANQNTPVKKEEIKPVLSAERPADKTLNSQKAAKQSNISKQTVKTSTVKTAPAVKKSAPITITPKASVTKTVTPKSTTAAKPNNTVNKPAVPVQKSQTQQKPQTTTQSKPKVQPKTQQMSEEYYNYKITLRQALFSKLSVVSIQGSGTCGIEFSIDSTGKLINRAFTYQSDNKSVNDEVYKMLMRMPKFYPPPNGKTTEKIKMVLKFNNGAYSVNYVD